MLVVLGSTFDPQPCALARRWRDHGREVALLTPADLAQPGWTLHVGNPDDSTAVIAGDRVTLDRIDAVVSALPWVTPYDVLHVVKDDRDYVAQEMTAFLLAWTHTLGCRVLDRPTTACLSGCGPGCSRSERLSGDLLQVSAERRSKSRQLRFATVAKAVARRISLWQRRNAGTARAGFF